MSKGRDPNRPRRQRMDPAGRPLRFNARAHLHPETFAPLVRFTVGDGLDISIDTESARQLAAMITDAVVVAELMAGHAVLLGEEPGITLSEFGPEDPTVPPAEALPQAIRDATEAFQSMLNDAWSRGAKGRGHTRDEGPPEPPGTVQSA